MKPFNKRTLYQLQLSILRACDRDHPNALRHNLWHSWAKRLAGGNYSYLRMIFGNMPAQEFEAWVRDVRQEIRRVNRQRVA